MEIAATNCENRTAFDTTYDNSATFADGTRTLPSNRLGFRKYVLARFQADASFDWVKRARAFLGRDELKYRDLASFRFDLVFRKFPPFEGEDLGKLLVREASTATIFLVDSEFYAQRIFREKLNDGAEFAVDFTFADVARETAEQMIREIPFHRLKPPALQRASEEFSLSTYRVKPRPRFVLEPPEDTDGPQVLQRIGGKLRDAEVFTARAYSLLDVDTSADGHGSAFTNPFYQSSRLAGGLFQRALLIPRIFDRDHSASIRVLNESLFSFQRTPVGTWRQEQLIREEDSRRVDALQAADIAAGLARETLDKKGLRAVAAQFRKVLLNGIDISRLRIFN